MFPDPSGAGLHVWPPTRLHRIRHLFQMHKRLKGFNVSHPMGFDAYGLPAEQYAIQTGQHPAITTEKNIARYREQLDKIGFSFDWDREVSKLAIPKYYKWTQWAFIQMFNHWFNKDTQKAEPIAKLVETFEKEGNANINAANSDTPILHGRSLESHGYPGTTACIVELPDRLSGRYDGELVSSAGNCVSQ